MTEFSLTNFIAEVGKDARRVGKSYLYEATFTFNKLSPQMKSVSPVNDDLLRKLTFFCNRTNLPGYRSDTQRGSIYGLPYEVASKLEQDPLWMSFYADILHKIPNLFFSGLRNGNQDFSVYGSGGDDAPFTPRYKNEYQFDVDIKILDENFKPVSIYKYTKCFIKTVQQLALSADSNAVPEVTVEIIYERMKTELVGGHSRPPVELSNPSTEWKNVEYPNTGFGVTNLRRSAT